MDCAHVDQHLTADIQGDEGIVVVCNACQVIVNAAPREWWLALPDFMPRHALILDRSEECGAVLSRILEWRQGTVVQTVESVDSALDVLRDHADSGIELDLIITSPSIQPVPDPEQRIDDRAPYLQFLGVARGLAPAAATILSTASPEEYRRGPGVASIRPLPMEPMYVGSILEKPIEIEDVGRAVRKAMAHRFLWTRRDAHGPYVWWSRSPLRAYKP